MSMTGRTDELIGTR